ncbi:MAG: PEP-CTERM sorting domain-containing protein [Mariniblastus sp.]|nr:PEP-CTERM sorting domain-containing protein [Mariniblastus sp.]
MKTNLLLLILAIFLFAAQSASADLIIIEDAAFSRLFSRAQNGVGTDSVVHVLNVGTKNNSNGWDMHAGLVFQMTGASAADLLNADFSISVTGGQGTPIYNVDVYANRVASTADFLVSDFEAGTKLMDDFVTTADGTTAGNYSLDSTGQANLLNYFKNNWVENDYVFLTLKSDQADFIMGEDANANYIFGGHPNGEATDADARLTLTSVPEPTSTALFGLGLGLNFLLRRRRQS